MNITFHFVGLGEVLEPRVGAIALDVGSKLLPGVIDHHQGSLTEDCAASLVCARPDLVLNHLSPRPARLEIILHRQPDLDCVAAAYFVKELVLTGHLPAAAKALAEYVRRLDAGHPPTDGVGPTSLSALFIASTELGADENAIPNDNERFLKWVNRGFALLELAAAGEPAEAEDVRLPEVVPGFEQEQALVAKDLQRYHDDCRRAEIFRVTLPDQRLGSRQVLGMFIEDPQALLFKHFARAESIVYTHIVYSQGSAAGLPDSPRHIISVAPDRGVWLRGLGTALEKAEVAARSLTGTNRIGTPRWPDVTNDDPWYDGRSPLHSYTIIDTPRGGTVLGTQAVKEICLETGAWISLGQGGRRKVCAREGCRESYDADSEAISCPIHGSSLVPRIIGGRYEMEALIAQGGMGAVYRVRDRVTQTPYALKLLKKELFKANDLWHRFVKEARALNRSPHPNIVRFVDFDADAVAGLFLVVEFLDGVTLERDLRRYKVGSGGTYPIDRLRGVIEQTCNALDAIHSPKGTGDLGFVHRDLKPGNLMLVGPDAPIPQLKVLDFGIAIAVDPNEPRLTELGHGIATVKYAAPEQIMDKVEIDGRADIYALGTILYEMLSGKTPFAGDATGTYAKCLGVPPDLSIIPDGSIRELTRDMLALDREKRPSTIEVKRRIAALATITPERS